MRHAFKEWAVICRALESGRQALLLRKGGIQESGGGFQVEHERFWLFPTYTHQQATGVVSDAQSEFEAVLAERPPDGVLHLRSLVAVDAAFHATELAQVLALNPYHIWSEETVQARFDYRRPGLFVLAVRTFVLPEPIVLANAVHYEGCKSWVELETEVDAEGLQPVISDELAAKRLAEIRKILSAATPIPLAAPGH